MMMMYSRVCSPEVAVVSNYCKERGQELSIHPFPHLSVVTSRFTDSDGLTRVQMQCLWDGVARGDGVVVGDDEGPSFTVGMLINDEVINMYMRLLQVRTRVLERASVVVGGAPGINFIVSLYTVVQRDRMSAWHKTG